MNNHGGSEGFLAPFQRSGVGVFTPVQRELDRIFDQMSRGWTSGALSGLTPCMDVSETKAAIEYAFELPGLTQKDIQITIEGDTLTISGEKKLEKETKDQQRRVIESHYGAFERSVSLPPSVDPGRIKAVMSDGVLRITVPKRAGAEPKTIEIQSAK
jgi:HSP20 family protein